MRFRGLRRNFQIVILLAAIVGVTHGKVWAAANPILFVTQVPLGSDFTNVVSTFGTQKADMQSAPRGGDLWIRYPDGTLKNLSAAAGYGSTDPTGFQGANAIAVRDPSVYWDGTKAVFSMIVGGTPQQYQWLTFHWQLYEVTGLGINQTPVITKVPNQPSGYNNVSPTYGTDDRLIFASDRPRGGASHLYPQLDEYEEAPTTSGLWSLDPATGDLQQLTHAPSGDFTPMIDSFGRVVFIQWDHLQRDQQADADANFGSGLNCDDGRQFGTFNYSSEAAGASYNLNDRTELFPEPRSCRHDLLAGTPWNGFEFNAFFPWTIAEDGSGAEIINHLGRHELRGYIAAARNDDPDIIDYYGQLARFNPSSIVNFLQVKEDPTQAGRYFGVDAPEFGTHAAGQVVSISAPPSLDADHISVTYVTHRDTSNTAATANNSGHYRDPLPLADGTVLVAHSPQTAQESGNGSPQTSSYSFRLKTLTSAANGFQTAGTTLTSGITKSVSYWDPDQLVTFNGTLWELNPVEVRARPRPVVAPPSLPAPEQQMFDAAGVTSAQLRSYLLQNNLALIISRNVTTRDDFDKQQPFNLRVPGGAQTTADAGHIYDLGFLQLFQGDLIRGLTGGSSTTPGAGRRVLAQTLHDPASNAANPAANGPPGSVAIAADGSMAAFVPARRALTWQLTDPNGMPVVRERLWLTFQPGEMRVCTSCHGLSQFDQAGHTAPTNPPQALLQLLQHWTASGGAATPAATASATATVATATRTPTPTATIAVPSPTNTLLLSTPPSTPVLSGRIRYYSADRSVPNVIAAVQGGMSGSMPTDLSGNFAFGGSPGVNVTLTPQKNGDIGSAITALDAAYVLQAAVGLRTFSDAQRLAGDVNGSGTISAIDATLILQYRVGLIGRLPVAQRCNADWAFIPAATLVPNESATMPAFAGNICQPGALAYMPLAGAAATQNFLGVVFGDCNGDWLATGGGAAVVAPAYHWGRLHRLGKRLRRVLYTEATLAPSPALEAGLDYDTTRLRPIAVHRLRPARQALVAWSSDANGHLHIAVAADEALPSTRAALLAVDFDSLH